MPCVQRGVIPFQQYGLASCTAPTGAGLDISADPLIREESFKDVTIVENK